MRQSRTQGYFPDLKAGTGAGIPTPRQNVVSEVRADPSAGSFAAGLAAIGAGFTDYFTQKTQVELAKAESKAKQQAQLDAQQAYESGVTSVSSEITKEYKGTYADTYSSALGSLRSSDAEKQFASFAVANDIQPHEYAQARTSFYNDNFGKGTGNINFDSAFQKSWTTNTQQLTHKNSIVAAQKIKDTARKSVDEAITSFSIETGNPNPFEFMNQVDQVRSVHRGYTEGQAISHVFGLYQFQATQSVNGALNYDAMLNQNIIPDRSIMAKPGTPGAVLPSGDTPITPLTSFAKRFPREATKARLEAFKIISNSLTLTGQQKLSDVVFYVNSLPTNIADIKDRSDIGDIQASFAAANSMIARIENTQGVTPQNIKQAKTALSKAQSQYTELMSGYAVVEQLAIGSKSGRQDAINDYSEMKNDEKDKALRVFLGTGNFSDLKFFRKFTNAFNNFSSLEGKTPQPFLDIIKDQFGSGDETTMKSIVAFAKIADKDGSIGAEAFKNDAENAVLYNQARIVGLEAAVSYAGNPEYIASVRAGKEAMSKGLGFFIDSTLTKQKDMADTAADFYLKVGNALDNQTTYFEGKPPSQALKDEINNVLPILKARLEAAGLVPSQDNLEEAVVQYFRPRTLVAEDTVMLGIPESQKIYAGFGPTGSRTMPLEYNRAYDPKFENAYIGTNVKPADGSEPQDTYENMRKSVRNMPIPGVDGDDLSVTIGTGERTGFGIIRSIKNFGAPVMFNAGQVIKKPKGPAATRFSVNTEYREGYTFTGDYSKDQVFVRNVLGSEYQLLPTGRGSYQLVVLPFFNDIEPMEERGEAPLGGQDLRRAVARSTAGDPIPLVTSTGPQAGEGMYTP